MLGRSNVLCNQYGIGLTVSAETLQPNESATAVVTGGGDDPFNIEFGIPKGAKGDPGTVPEFSIGTVQKGANAAATITGTASNPVLNLTLPKGDPGYPTDAQVAEAVEDWLEDNTSTVETLVSDSVETLIPTPVNTWLNTNAATTIDDWLDDNITQETGYVLDRSLTASDAAAPADLVGSILDVRPYQSGNLFDSSTATTGKLLNVSTYVLDNNYNCGVTDYIPVLPGDVITRDWHLNSQNYGDAYYDASKQPIEGVASNENTLTHVAPQNAAYVRLSYMLNSASTISVTKTTRTSIIEDLSNDVDNIEKSMDDVANDPPNKFNPSTVTAGKCIRISDLSIINFEVCCVSDYIAVTPGNIITVNQNLGSSQYGHAFYNSSKTALSGVISNAQNMSFTVPDGAAYIRLTVVQATKNDFVCNILTPFTNYIKNVLPSSFDYIEESIDEVSESLDYVVSDPPNSFDVSTISDKYAFRVSDNSLVTHQSCCVSAYIAVEPGMVVSVNMSLGSADYGHALYNASQIIQDVIPSNAANMSFVIPDGIAYIRLTVFRATKENFICNILTPFTNYVKNELPKNLIITANPFARKTLKEYGTALDGYTHCAFPSVAQFGNKEVVAYRASKSHYTPTDTSDWGGIMIDYRTPDGEWVHKGLLDTSSVSFNGELRDPKLTVSRDGNTLFCACFTTYRKPEAPSTDIHDDVLFTLDSNLEVTGGFVISEASYFFWGNTLITPNGYLLQAAYAGSSIVLYRSTAAFNGDISAITFGSPIILNSNSTQEATIGYWNDKLVCICRRGTNSSYMCYTENLEGDSGWSTASAPTGALKIHAPVLLPYWRGKYLPFAGAKYDSSSMRYTIFGLISMTGTTFKYETYATVDPAIIRFSGYCGMTYFGGCEFSLAYYLETHEQLSTMGAHTAVYYKHINARTLLPAMAYMQDPNIN